MGRALQNLIYNNNRMLENTKKDKRIKELQKMSKGQLVDIHKRLFKVGTPKLSDKESLMNDILDAEGLI